MAQSDGPSVIYKVIDAPDLVSMPVHDALLDYAMEGPLGNTRALEPEPYGLVVENASTETIIAYVLRVALSDISGGTQIKQKMVHNFNLLPGGGVTPNGMEISPGSAQLIAPSVAIPIMKSATQREGRRGSGGPPAATGLQEFAEQQDAVVSLDLVVYESGRVVGPNEGGMLFLVQSQLDLERQLAALLYQELQSSKSMADIRDLLNRKDSLSPRLRLSGTEAAGHWQDLAMRNVSGFYLYKARISRQELVKTIDVVMARPTVTLHR